MTKIYKSLAVLTVMILVGTSAFSQMEFHLVTGFGTRFNDINSTGQGVTQNGYYDFAPNTLTAIEDTATGVAAINDNGDVSGSMYLDEDQTAMQPAYRLDGQWHGIGWFPEADPSASSFSTHKISENSQYVVGDMADGCCEFGAFIYDTQSEEFTGIIDTATTYRGYAVNSNGILAGWLDYNTSDMGTLRQPMYRTTDGEFHVIPDGQAPTTGVNAVWDINDNNVMVGDFNNAPFIYYMEADSFVTFTVPEGWMGGSFTGISDNGIAVGYYQNIIPGGAIDRRAIIYHPDLGNEPIMLADLATQNGAVLNTDDGFLGTVIAISANGEYAAGWVNGPPMFAEGWALHLGDILGVATCSFDCPAPIDTTVAMNEASIVLDYTIDYTCDENAPDDVELVQTAGLPSGSEFPIGTTTITYQLVNPADSSVITTCSFPIVVHDSYCDIDYPNIEPITYVEFGDISNTSDVNSTLAQEFFFDQTTTVMQNSTQTIGVQGTTGGDFIDSVAVFFDWNHDGAFTADEMSFVGALENSTGQDGQQVDADILIPADAELGETRMRVSKAYSINPVEPCGTTYNYGQSEDYLIMVDENTGIDDLNAVTFRVYPNVTKDFVRIFAGKPMTRASVYSVTGRLLISKNLNNAEAEVNLSQLANGVYVLKVTAGDAAKSFKIVKQ